MGFKSGKRRSGVRMAGATGRSNTSRVARSGKSAAGSMRRSSNRPGMRGSEAFNTPILTDLGFTDIIATGATANIGTDRPGDGTMYWVAQTAATVPTREQIKAGLDGNGAAAQDSGSGAATNPFVTPITGLVTVTLYRFYIYQEADQADSAVFGTFFTTV